MTALDHIGEGKYALLTTYRRDGKTVGTPVWVVRDGDALAVWTPTDSWKVKRIRREAHITVAPCTFKGQPTGEAVAARAELLDADATSRVRGLIKKKYWLTGPLTVGLSRLRRGADGTIGIRITPA